MITVIKRNKNTCYAENDFNESQDLFVKKFVCKEFRVKDDETIEAKVSEYEDNNQEKIEFKNVCVSNNKNSIKHIKVKNGYKSKFNSTHKSFHKRTNHNEGKTYEGSTIGGKFENSKKICRNIHTFDEPL